MAEPHQQADINQLIAAVTAKLEANREIIGRSTSYGRLGWRKGKNGSFEIDLELKL